MHGNAFVEQLKNNFWEASYGSLKESEYLVDFSFKENFINEAEYKYMSRLADEIGAMLWKCIQSLR